MHIIKTKSRRRLKVPRLDLERFPSLILGSRQPHPEIPVHNLLEGLAGLARLFLQQHGDIVIEGQSGSHIMMLSI